MLTKMPQVGDKVRCISENYLIDVSVGTVYEITGLDGDSNALFVDDAGDERYINKIRFDKFELVAASPAQPVGRVELHDVRKSTAISETGHRTNYAFTVYADADGYDAIERLADAYTTQGKRADLERRIAELQKELAAL